MTPRRRWGTVRAASAPAGLKCPPETRTIGACRTERARRAIEAFTRRMLDAGESVRAARWSRCSCSERTPRFVQGENRDVEVCDQYSLAAQGRDSLDIPIRGFDGTVTNMEELAYQRWEGERIAEETFFMTQHSLCEGASYGDDHPRPSARRRWLEPALSHKLWRYRSFTSRGSTKRSRLASGCCANAEY
jgi:hypothetical protein